MAMRKQYNQQLELLHSEMITMGALCEEAISSAAKCFSESDAVYRENVIEKEKLIDRMEKDIENLCLTLILHQQPVASDLRAISSALKMISDMERIGDQACDIVDILDCMDRKSMGSVPQILEMARETITMVTNSVESFVRSDKYMALSVINHDDIVDKLFSDVKAELISELKNAGVNGEALLDTLMIAKYFERIGDHAVNVAEWVLFSITGEHI